MRLSPNNFSVFLRLMVHSIAAQNKNNNDDNDDDNTNTNGGTLMVDRH